MMYYENDHKIEIYKIETKMRPCTDYFIVFIDDAEVSQIFKTMDDAKSFITNQVNS